MPESVDAWWKRRQWSKGVDVPYAIGRFRSEWLQYPVLVRQFHPDLNHGVTLSQVPPAAEVYLQWQCDAGHRFVATPEEQRQRPGHSRRRSTWCPECAAGAVRPRMPTPAREEVPAPLPLAGAARSDAAPFAVPAPSDAALPALPAQPDSAPLAVPVQPERVPREGVPLRAEPRQTTRGSARTRGTEAPRPRQPLACGHPRSAGGARAARTPDRCRVCDNARAGAALVTPGSAFVSRWAPRPSSRAEADLRQRVAARLDVDLSPNAVRVAQPFFAHLEVWPDIVIGELLVAIEFDTTGRDGLEHVGGREVTDRRKDRLLRAVGWEVVRIRCGKLPPIGPFDLVAPGVSAVLIDRLIDRLGEIRGELMVASYAAG